MSLNDIDLTSNTKTTSQLQKFSALHKNGYLSPSKWFQRLSPVNKDQEFHNELDHIKQQ
jgi:hypothetical protein